MNAHSIKRLLVRTAAVGAVALVAVSLAACSTAQSPAPTTQAATPAPASAPAAATKSAPAAGSAAAATSATVADGQSVVKTSCVGRCHPSALLNYRTSSTSAQRIASSMGRRAGLSNTQQQAVAIFLAQ